MRKSLIAVLALALFAAPVLAADDASVLGKGKMELEADLIFEDFGAADTTELDTTFTYGLLDNLDLYVTLPYVIDNGADESGMGDLIVGAKYKFFTQDAWSLAVDFALIPATGDDAIAAGEDMDYGIEFIASYAKAPLTVDINFIYYYVGELEEGLTAWDVEVNYAMAPWTFIGELYDSETVDALGDVVNEDGMGLILGAAYKLNDKLELEGDFETNTEEFMDLAVLKAIATYQATSQLELEFDLGFGIGDLTEDYTLFEVIATYSF